MNLPPEKALEHLDGIAAKYHGTRSDHSLLSSCVSVLRDVVMQWRTLLEEKKKEKEVKQKPVIVTEQEIPKTEVENKDPKKKGSKKGSKKK